MLAAGPPHSQRPQCGTGSTLALLDLQRTLDKCSQCIVSGNEKAVAVNDIWFYLGHVSRSFRASAAAVSAPMALTPEGLQQPHGGKLVNLFASAEARAAIIKSATKTLELSDRNACDVELLSVG